MNEILENVDIKELGIRLAATRKKLGLRQTEVAIELGTTQLMVSKVERGENVVSSFLLRLLLFYSQSVSLDYLFGRDFNANDEALLQKSFPMATIAKEKLTLLREQIAQEMARQEKLIDDQLQDAADLL
jgi:transcriptional regulator with XRE-family HTH domain